MSTNVLIIEARFYDTFHDLLLQGAKVVLDKAGASYDVVTVPGALEIPSILSLAAKNTSKYDAYIVLGVVIRGETTHYDLVCNESARGIYNVALEHDLAVGNGILTVENEEQALDRADPARQDKGGGAAKAALAVLELKKKFAA